MRGFEWRALWERSRGQEIFAFTNLARPAACLVFAPDGRTLVSGGDDGVHLWDVAEGRPLGLFPGPDPGPTSGDRAPTDEELRPMLEASPAVVDHVKVQPGIRDYLDAWGHTGRTRAVKSLSFTPDGKHLLVGSSDFVRSWTFATGAFDFAVPENMARVGTPGTGDLFVVANDQVCLPDDEQRTAHPQSALLYSYSRRRLVAELPGYGFRVAISPDGGYVAATGRTNGVVLWQPATGKTVPLVRTPWGSSFASFSPDGRTLFVNSNHRTFLWDLQSERIRAELNGAHRLAAAADWSPDGRTLATGGDQSVALWRVPPAGATNGPDDGPPLLLPHTVLQGHEAAVTALAFSPDGRRLASAATDHSIRLWAIADASAPVAAAPATSFVVEQFGESPLDAATGCLIGRVREHVSGRPTGKLAVLDARLGSVPQPLPGTEHQLYAGYLAQRQGFVTVELGTNDVPVQFELRRLPDGAVRTRRQFRSVPDGVRYADAAGIPCLSASPDGRWLALAQTDAKRDRNLEVYDLRTGQFVARLPGVPQTLITRLRVSPDSRWLVRLDHINGDNWITTYDSQTWGPPREIRFRSAGKDVLLATIDPASRRLATAGPDGNSLRIWDLLTGRLEAQCASGGLACHPVWSPDSRTLVFNYGSGVHFWSMIVFRELTSFHSDFGRVGAPLGYTPDGHTLVGFTWDGEVKTWSPRTLAEIDRLP